MSRIRILLAEDNPLHASKVEMLLDLLDYDLVGVGSTKAEVIQMHSELQPDLMIMDIELSDGSDGVKTAEVIHQDSKVPVIFLSSYEDRETISRALKTNPFAYLVKPVEKGNLQAAIELALAKSGVDVTPDNATEFNQVLLQNSFFVKSGSKLQKVKLEDVLWVEVAQDRYCDLVTKEKRFQVRSSLNHLEDKLDPSTFIRTHRTTIINLNHIDGIDEFEMVVEVNGHSLPLGNSYKSNFLNKLKMI